MRAFTLGRLHAAAAGGSDIWLREPEGYLETET